MKQSKHLNPSEETGTRFFYGFGVSPSIFGLMIMGSVMLFICSVGCVLCCTGSGVKRVHVVLSGLRMRLFVCVHV